jgi:hypothetical protein
MLLVILTYHCRKPTYPKIIINFIGLDLILQGNACKIYSNLYVPIIVYFSEIRYMSMNFYLFIYLGSLYNLVPHTIYLSIYMCFLPFTHCILYRLQINWGYKKKYVCIYLFNSMVWVRERTIPTERPPLVGEYICIYTYVIFLGHFKLTSTVLSVLM